MNFLRFLLALCFLSCSGASQDRTGNRDILALYTGKYDPAHVSFVREANIWFKDLADTHGFTYTSSQDWNKLQDDTLKKYELIIFLDTRPDSLDHRKAFERYIKRGGAWIGFHFSAFALTPSLYPQNWNWYHVEFLGCGQYVSNTWRPTPAILSVEDISHPIFRNMPPKFQSSANEWYKWEYDLRKNPDIKILASIDPESFPLGTGPKSHEIWHEGYYPVVWTNTRYRMVYFNMGHNDLDYEGKTNRELSVTFKNDTQNQFVLNAVLWLLSPGIR